MRTLIISSFILAFIFTVIPLSPQWQWFRPEFAILLVIYWSIHYPQYFGLIPAWLVGLSKDIIELSPMGINAMSTLLVAYITHLVYQRIRNYSVWHQAIWVFILVGIFQLFSNWLGGFIGKAVSSPIYLIAAVISGFLWPFLSAIMSYLLMKFRLING